MSQAEPCRKDGTEPWADFPKPCHSPGDPAGTLQDTTNTCPAVGPPAAPSQLLSLKMGMENLLADGAKLIWHTLQRSWLPGIILCSIQSCIIVSVEWQGGGRASSCWLKFPPEAAIVHQGFDGCFQYYISFPEVSADPTVWSLLSLWSLSFLSFFSGVLHFLMKGESSVGLVDSQLELLPSHQPVLSTSTKFTLKRAKEFYEKSPSFHGCANIQKQIFHIWDLSVW